MNYVDIEIVNPSVKPLVIEPMAYELIEQAGRTCYKSERFITGESAKAFCTKIKKLRHLSVLEFAKATFRIICDRGVSHELVRHRLASYCQESTRYCNYKNKVTFVKPHWLDESILGKIKLTEDTPEIYRVWYRACKNSAVAYKVMLEHGCTPQDARAVLNNSVKTEIVMSANFREWLHFLELRCSKQAHPDMQVIANLIKAELVNKYPIIFDYEETK